MRGDDHQQEAIFSYIGLEDRVPKDHPLRAIRQMADQALHELDAEFQRLYARVGRPSVAPEKLIRAQLLQALYSVRSERQLMEQLDYNLLFRWFVGLNIDDPVWDVTVFTKKPGTFAGRRGRTGLFQRGGRAGGSPRGCSPTSILRLTAH